MCFTYGSHCIVVLMVSFCVSWDSELLWFSWTCQGFRPYIKNFWGVKVAWILWFLKYVQKCIVEEQLSMICYLKLTFLGKFSNPRKFWFLKFRIHIAINNDNISIRSHQTGANIWDVTNRVRRQCIVDVLIIFL